MSLLTDGRITLEDVKIAIGWLSASKPEIKIVLDVFSNRRYNYELRVQDRLLVTGTKRDVYQYIRAMLEGINLSKHSLQ